MEREYDMKLASAYVRGMARRTELGIDAALLDKPLDTLSAEEMQQLIAAGERAELKMYRFKNHEELPRVRKALGFLKAIQPQNLLDVGSGRGAFLFPFLREFPWTEVTSVDILPHRVELLAALSGGGMDSLTALLQDVCSWDMPDGSFDVVTMLEVLEHIPDVGRAVREAVRLARRYVVLTVPSKPDNNPEHIHLLTKERLTELFGAVGCTRLQFDGVNGHLFMTARIGS